MHGKINEPGKDSREYLHMGEGKGIQIPPPLTGDISAITIPAPSMSDQVSGIRERLEHVGNKVHYIGQVLFGDNEETYLKEPHQGDKGVNGSLREIMDILDLLNDRLGAIEDRL